MTKLIVTWAPDFEAGKNQITSKHSTIWEARKARAAELGVDVVCVCGRWLDPPTD